MKFISRVGQGNSLVRCARSRDILFTLEINFIFPCNHVIFSIYFNLSRMFSYGEFKAEDQEQMLKALNKKVEEVYRNTIGDNEANIR